MEKKNKQNAPEQEQIDETLRLCEGYSHAVERLFENREKLARLQSRQKEVLSAFEQTIYQNNIAKTEEQIREDEENTAYFRWALFHLNAREYAVIKQLYVDGYTWRTVLSETGEKMTAGAIDKARKRGLLHMTQLISEAKLEMQAARAANTGE